ncbi:flagellar basal-body rod protein FlgF [Methylomonas sp. AM2-LC]|uniref:flagellar basal-body rod protein FlgF n=1 Tax=Methylomonas sp. AM2-LC TaxID=3153301 RepID=UPI0032645363
MDRSLYVAMNGAKQTMLAQTANANNLANGQTTAFKADFEQFRAMPAFGPGYPARVFTMTERPGTNLATGTLQTTGRDLDIAIDGKGWLAVKTKDGTEAYTRAGDLKLTPEGMLQNSNGLPILNDSGNPIVIPPTRKIAIGSDGTISTIAQGATANSTAILDRIKLVNPDPSMLEKRSDGLMYRKQVGLTVADPNVKLVQGSLESSNVNVMSAMVEMLELSKHYELQVKAMKSADDNAAASAALVKLA